MKRYFLILALVLASCFSGVIHAEEPKHASVFGGFEMAGFLDAGFGWQRYSNDPITELANDGSYAGVLGSVISNTATGIPPAPGQDDVEGFVELAELDIIKSFGERTKLRADIYFGRPVSGSWVNGTDIEQAYAAIMLWKKHAVEIVVGRFGTQAGFEPFEPFNLDTISWSILTRANIYPYLLTGAQLSFDLTHNISIYVAASNGFTNDSTRKINDAPSWVTTITFRWGPDNKTSSFVLTPFFGPESNSNRPFTYGADATLKTWVTENLEIGVQGIFRRDNGNGGPNTNYAAGLLNLHWIMAEGLYGVAKYAYVNQLDTGNVVYNLTGAKQQIHEASIGLGYSISDGMKFKWEGRLDIIAPSSSARQWVPGTAIELACAF